jgi:hypothetical protein
VNVLQRLGLRGRVYISSDRPSPSQVGLCFPRRAKVEFALLWEAYDGVVRARLRRTAVTASDAPDSRLRLVAGQPHVANGAVLHYRSATRGGRSASSSPADPETATRRMNSLDGGPPSTLRWHPAPDAVVFPIVVNSPPSHMHCAVLEVAAFVSHAIPIRPVSDSIQQLATAWLYLGVSQCHTRHMYWFAHTHVGMRCASSRPDPSPTPSHSVVPHCYIWAFRIVTHVTCVGVLAHTSPCCVRHLGPTRLRPHPSAWHRIGISGRFALTHTSHALVCPHALCHASWVCARVVLIMFLP